MNGMPRAASGAERAVYHEWQPFPWLQAVREGGLSGAAAVAFLAGYGAVEGRWFDSAGLALLGFAVTFGALLGLSSLRRVRVAGEVIWVGPKMIPLRAVTETSTMHASEAKRVFRRAVLPGGQRAGLLVGVRGLGETETGGYLVSTRALRIGRCWVRGQGRAVVLQTPSLATPVWVVASRDPEAFVDVVERARAALGAVGAESWLMRKDFELHGGETTIRVGVASLKVATTQLVEVRRELGRMQEQGDLHSTAAITRLDAVEVRRRGRVDLLTHDEMRAIAMAVDRVRLGHPEWDFDFEWWGLANLRRACELVAGGASPRETARWMAKQRRVRWERRRELNRQGFEADPTPRSSVFAYGVVLTGMTAFLIWALRAEVHLRRDRASKPFWLALIAVLLAVVAFPLFSAFMARTRMEAPWVPVYRFLDTMRVNLSLVIGLATFLAVRSTPGGGGSRDYYTTAAGLIGVLAVALAVEARFSAAARSEIPFRGVAVLMGFTAISFSEYVCLHVLAVGAGTRSDLAVVAGVLVGIAASVALLAALGPMPYQWREGDRTRRSPRAGGPL